MPANFLLFMWQFINLPFSLQIKYALEKNSQVEADVTNLKQMVNGLRMQLNQQCDQDYSSTHDLNNQAVLSSNQARCDLFTIVCSHVWSLLGSLLFTLVNVVWLQERQMAGWKKKDFGMGIILQEWHRLLVTRTNDQVWRISISLRKRK